jgi:Rrf2 family protein
MLRISRKADYAIFLLCYLARGEKATSPGPGALPGALMSAAELSELTGLSHSLVANLLKDYARAGILESVRGQSGGYRLARPASQLNLREILAVVEGPLSFVECAETPPTETRGGLLCDLMPICPSKGPLQILHNRIVGMLEALKLSEVASATPSRLPLLAPQASRTPCQ